MSLEHKWNNFLSNASAGQKLVYATTLVLDSKTDPTVLKVAGLAKQAFAQGNVELVQRRTVPGGPFDYIAIKRAVVRVPKVGGAPWQTRICQYDQ